MLWTSTRANAYSNVSRQIWQRAFCALYSSPGMSPPTIVSAADLRFMRLAWREAAGGIGHASPNPAVGAVIVRAGRVLSRGYHHAAGQPHAEIEALRALERLELARGATIYVTLEPCSTHGRTPPCTEAILNAGLARVVIGATDPNPHHAGRARTLLEARGVSVTEGVMGEECRQLNPGFNRWIVSGLPWVIAKAALTLDGRINRPPARGNGCAARKPAPMRTRCAAGWMPFSSVQGRCEWTIHD